MNKFSSIFGQILQIFSKTKFQNAVIETKAEKKVKGFACWEQFVAMIFCQLEQAHSLREIYGAAYRKTKEAVRLHLLLEVKRRVSP